MDQKQRTHLACQRGSETQYRQLGSGLPGSFDSTQDLTPLSCLPPAVRYPQLIVLLLLLLLLLFRLLLLWWSLLLLSL